MSDEWIYMLPKMISGRITENFSKSLKKKYQMTDINFSTVGSSNTPAVFPFVLIEELDSSEIGNDLDGLDTSGLRYSVRIHVSDNNSQTNAKEIAYEARRIMKTMRFSCGAPVPQNIVNNVYGYVVQCSRIIGEGDIL